MILTGFADPDKDNFERAPESERRQGATLSVPPQAIAGITSKEQSWDTVGPTEPAPADTKKR